MQSIYTIIVDGLPYHYTADVAPAIGQEISLDDSTTVRVLRSTDGGRLYNAELVPSEGE